MNTSVSKPSLFVGSSSEGLEVARAIQVQLADVADVELWNEDVFSLGYGTLEALVQALSRFDFAVLVLTPDDLTISRGVQQGSARDNVLIELGLFIGRLGRERTFLLCSKDGDIKVPSDLAGITFATYSQPRDQDKLIPALGPACVKIRNAIRAQGKATQIQTLESKVTRQEQQLSNQQEVINQLVIYSMSASIYYHLWFISETREYFYHEHDWFRREMNYLRDNGYIQPIREGFLTFDHTLHGKNLVDIATHTPVDEFYVKLRGTPPEVQHMIAEGKPIQWKPGKQPA